MFDQLLQQKWFLRVVALLLAILLYLTVIETSSSNNQTSALPVVGQSTLALDVPIEVFFDESEYVAYNVPETINVDLQGPSSSLTMTRLVKDYQVFVDLTNLGTGFHRVPIEARGFGGDVSVNLERETIEVYIDQKETIDVPVSVNVLNKDGLPEGFVTGDVVVEPKVVQVTGGASRLQNVKEVTLDVDVRGRTKTFTSDRRPKIFDANGNPLNVQFKPNIVKVTVPIYEQSKVVPIEVKTEGDVAGESRLIDTISKEAVVRVFGDAETLRTIDRVVTEPIDLDGFKETTQVQANLVTPKGAEELDFSQVEVQVVVRPKNDPRPEEVNALTQWTRLTVPVEIRGYDRENYTLQVPEVVVVTLSGKRSVLQELTSNSVTATLDLMGLPEGTHGIDVDYEVPKGVVVVFPNMIDVSLTSIPEQDENLSTQ